MSDYAILMFGTLGFTEIVVIFLIILLLFGAKRLPEIARSLGKAINEFKKTKDDIMNYDDTESNEDSKVDKIDAEHKKEVKATNEEPHSNDS
jgi:TatA/E family protein of Tat protein translocase